MQIFTHNFIFLENIVLFLHLNLKFLGNRCQGKKIFGKLTKYTAKSLEKIILCFSFIILKRIKIPKCLIYILKRYYQVLIVSYNKDTTNNKP